jgi:uncharacterized protein (DUF58 family)
LTGRATLLVGVALVFVGAAFDSPSLYVPGLALATLSLGLRSWVRIAARSTRVERLPGPWSVVEGDRYPLTLRIRRGRMPAPGGRLLDPLLESPRTFGMRLPKQISAEARLMRRGRRRLEPATLLIADPLGLGESAVRSSGEVEVLVLPRVEPVVAGEGHGDAADEERPDGSERGIGGAGLDSGAIAFEIDGLRPYRDGSPASRIHWPTVARTGELHEHKLITGGRASPLVVLDASDPVNEDSLDAAVRAAASLCYHLARAGGCALLIPGEVRLLEIGAGLRAWPEIHARLALVESGAPPPRMRRWPRGELVFWVTARAQPQLPRSAGGPGITEGFLVAPAAIRSGRSSFTVAGCNGQRLESPPRPSRAVRAGASA